MPLLTLQALRQGLTPLELGFDELSASNVLLIIGELEKIKSSLPKLKDEEITKTVTLLDRYLGGKPCPEKRWSFL